MKYKIINKNETNILIGNKDHLILSNEQDALDLLGICGANQARKILLYAESIISDFFDLKTGVAGAILQKFINYSITSAYIITEEQDKGRFGELISELNKYNNHFHFFYNEDDAINWLAKN